MSDLNERKCPRCRKYRNRKHFESRYFHKYNKLCDRCLSKFKCKHGKNEYNCLDCKGMGTCQMHQKTHAPTCTKCIYGDVCPCGKPSYYCLEHGGGGLCRKHGFLRTMCIMCCPVASRPQINLAELEVPLWLDDVWDSYEVPDIPVWCEEALC